MTFETRQQNRKIAIERVMFASKVLAVFYLALHGAVTALAYKMAGAWAAFLTLITLGFGDFYWAVTWLREGGQGLIAAVALVAALTCFASWVLRPIFDRWASEFTASMLSDTAEELNKLMQANDDKPPSEPEADR